MCEKRGLETPIIAQQTQNPNQTPRPKNAQPSRKFRRFPLRIIRCLTVGSSDNLGNLRNF